MGTDTIVITIPGVPVPWARAWGGKTTKLFTPPKQRAYMKAVKLVGQAAMRGKKPLQGPLDVRFYVIFKGPKGWKTTRGDADNYYKIVADSLNGVCYEDDAQICHLTISKMFGHQPQMAMCITPLEKTDG